MQIIDCKNVKAHLRIDKYKKHIKEVFLSNIYLLIVLETKGEERAFKTFSAATKGRYCTQTNP